MSKHQSQLSHRKILVRNTEDKLPATKVIDSTQEKISKVQISSSRSTGAIKKNTSRALVQETGNAYPKFNNPQTQSTEQISQKMKTVQNIKPKQVQISCDVDKNDHLILNDKITKHMNFPYEQPIYRDLIPLCARMQSKPMIISSREPLPLKDKEPVLSVFFVPKAMSDYTYKVPTSVSDKEQTRYYKGLKLHRTINTWCD